MSPTLPTPSTGFPGWSSAVTSAATRADVTISSELVAPDTVQHLGVRFSFGEVRVLTDTEATP